MPTIKTKLALGKPAYVIIAFDKGQHIGFGRIYKVIPYEVAISERYGIRYFVYCYFEGNTDKGQFNEELSECDCFTNHTAALKELGKRQIKLQKKGML